jgi:hypothetical protein
MVFASYGHTDAMTPPEPLPDSAAVPVAAANSPPSTPCTVPLPRQPRTPTAERSDWRGAALRVFSVACFLAAAVFVYQALPPAWKGAVRPTPGNQNSNGRALGPRLKTIEDIHVGDRVAADGPVAADDDDELAAEVDTATWRRLELRAPKVDGSFAEVELLRPPSWLAREQARVGGTVQIDVPECGISGQAAVLAIRECPLVKVGKGRVVTGTFKHTATRVLDIYLEGQDRPLGVTPNHPCWSEDRQQFVRADELRVAERLRGQWGTPRVLRVVPRQSPEAVYNLEVQGSHVYHVTPAGVLVHNATPRTGYVYEITYVENGMTRVYVGQAGSGAQDVYERLWGSKAGENSLGNKGRDILRAYADAKVRIWQVDLTDTPRGRGYLGTQEQHAQEEVIRTQGAQVLDNAEEARSKELGSAYKDSSKKNISEVQQQQIREEIRRLQAEGGKLPDSTPANRPIEEMTKYDLDTLRYGDQRGKPVVDAPQATAKEQASLLCSR